MFSVKKQKYVTKNTSENIAKASTIPTTSTTGSADLPCKSCSFAGRSMRLSLEGFAVSVEWRERRCSQPQDPALSLQTFGLTTYRATTISYGNAVNF